MDVAIESVAEQVAEEFPDRGNTTVLEVVSECVAEFPDDDGMFIEQVVKARLRQP